MNMAGKVNRLQCHNKREINYNEIILLSKHVLAHVRFLQVVWHSTQDEFIRQYKHFEDLIGRCYPGSGITMEFTIQDMLEYFSSIAQSH